jgi:hypothetical protein
MLFCFVSTRRGSHFMTELLGAIAAATAEAGHDVDFAFDQFPALQEECVYVVIPHEFQAWGAPSGVASHEQRAHTIALCTENPGTPWFEHTYELVPQFASAVSINRSSAAELERRGIPCEHLQLGYSPLWDRWRRDDTAQRPLDVLYLGAADPRRDPLLAGLGADLWARECQLLIPPLEPRTGPRPDFLTGAEKYDRLGSAKTLLNLHRTQSAALEWMRFLEAICNGCVVVSEPCLDNQPLLAGEHFVSASADSVASSLDCLLEDPDRLQLMRERAYDFVLEELPMRRAGERLAALAAELPRRPPWTAGSDAEAIARTGSEADAEQAPWHECRSATESWARSSVSTRSTTLQRRPFAQIYRRIRARQGSVVRTLGETAAFARSAPRVSVLSVISNATSPTSIEALSSVAASVSPELELLVLDDGSHGEATPELERFFADHPSLPARLLRQPVNRGLAHSRNTLVRHARGEYLFTLDPTGGIYPSTLQRLSTALDADTQAIFSYPMVAVFDDSRAVELASALPWEPGRLKRGNWIDGMALIRRERLLALGGYSVDPRLAGWEDFQLWCKCAEAGGHAVHIPQVLAWRRLAANRATPAKWALMRELFPGLLADQAG